jgi:eukaryotic-like serine/threonine-protein kinase
MRMSFQPGQRIGEYEVMARLGAGGLGEVYEVRHLISERREAMKLLLPDQSGTPEMVERFRREVKTLATLNHVNIAALHTAFYHEDQLAMVMELIHGETLRDRQLKGPIPLPEALDIMAQTLRALAYAHQLGVVHRDIKPSNIMISQDAVVKLLDFGIAVQEQTVGLTRAGYLLGSIHYMSPEQVNGQKATPRSDLYSVGVTLYELLTGKLPVTGSNNYEIMMGHIERVPIAVRQLAPHISTELSHAVMRSLEKDPGQRHRSAQEFLTALVAGSGEQHRFQSSTTPLPMPTPPAPQLAVAMGARKSTSGSGFESLPLEEVSRKLAAYIGPVAKLVIKKLAAQSTDLDTIYREAAKQISSETDRAAFLRSKKQL